MRKIICTIVILLAIPVTSRADLSVTLIDSIKVADTADESIRIDTLFSTPIKIPSDARVLYFTSLWQPLEFGAISDTNFLNDSLRVMLQHSADKRTWTDWGTNIQVILNASADLDTVIMSALRIRTDTLTGAGQLQQYVRAKFIYQDSLETTQPGLLDNVYKKYFSVFINFKP